MKNLNNNNGNNWLILLISFFLSLLLWFFWTMEEQTQTSITFKTKYINIPKDRIIVSKLPQKVEVQIEATGFYLLSQKMKNNGRELEIDLSSINSNNFILSLYNNIPKIDNGRILSTVPENIQIISEIKATKKVKIELSADIEYKKGYNLEEPITMEPEFVYVSGKQEYIKNIYSIKTEKIRLKNLDKEFKKTIKLEAPENVKISSKKVKLTIKPVVFTQTKLRVDINVRNIGENIVIIPSKAEVLIQSSFENSKKIEQSKIKLFVDIRDTLKNNNSNILTIYSEDSIKFNHKLKINPDYVIFVK